MDDSPIYFRVFLDGIRGACVAEMQWFDEYNYKGGLFVGGTFKDEKQAEQLAFAVNALLASDTREFRVQSLEMVVKAMKESI